MGTLRWLIEDEDDLISDPGNATTRADEHVDSAASMSAQAYASGLNAISTMTAITIPGQEMPAVSTIPLTGVSGINADEPTVPEIQDITTAVVNFEGVVPSTVSLEIDSRPIPEYVENDYGFAIPEQPEVTWPTFVKEAPVGSEIAVPTVPSVDLPPVPSITDVAVPAPPEYSLPDFDGVLPVDDLTEPVVNFNWSEAAYTSELNTVVTNSIQGNIITGGTGLDEATEQAIYDRAKSRMEEEEQLLLDNVASGLAARGFPIPPGALVGGVLEAENKILRSRTDLNNDILVQQSKLAQENTHFMHDKAIQVEQIMIGYHNEVQGRLLDAQKFTVSVAVQMYGARVEAYKARLQAYATLAEVYKARIQGEIAKAEFYKAQIEGVKVSIGVQQLMIEAYKTQVESIKVIMESYRIQMEGARIHAEIDKTKIEAFVSEVQAFVARTNAVTARYEGYKAQISGEVAKAEMYKANADAYNSRVQGYKAAAEVDVARAEVQLTNVKIQAEVYKALIDKYQADIQRAMAEAEIAAKREGLKVDIFKAHTQKYAAEVDALIRIYMTQVEQAKNILMAQIQMADVNGRISIAQAQIAAENIKAIAHISGQIAAAAASSVSASFHVSAADNRSDSTSRSTSHQYSKSRSDSQSYIYQHIYDHSDS
jgi:hypothetical protein